MNVLSRFALVILNLMFLAGARAAVDPARSCLVVPKPVDYHLTGGTFEAGPSVSLRAPEALAEVAWLASQELGARGTDGAAATSGGSVELSRDETLPREAYTLKIARSGVSIVGGSASGVYYGVQTLRQIIGVGTIANTVLPCLAIKDSPRFGWRGLLIDCSRTFQSLDYLRATIDRMAFYKLNVLQLHLTDDQGWRFETRRYPELTQNGSRFSARYSEPASHQGFYTQAELKDLVHYASLRGITIVPEIEMPGHCLAALVSHPELSCTGQIPDNIYPFFKGPWINKDVYCAGNEATFQFLENVLAEVIEVFPSEYIHIGGDEVPKDRWTSCPKCQARMKAEGLTTEKELQSYFVRRMGAFLASKGRRLVGWDEILEGGLAPGAVVMSWRGVEGGAAAAKVGHHVVMSPTKYCYFDHPYETTDAPQVYRFEPTFGLSAGEAANLLGVHACFWSHIDREPAKVDRQLFPRLLPFAERAWSPKDSANWTEFRPRLEAQIPRLAAMGIHYYDGALVVPPEKHIPDPYDG